MRFSYKKYFPLKQTGPKFRLGIQSIRICVDHRQNKTKFTWPFVQNIKDKNLCGLEFTNKIRIHVAICSLVQISSITCGQRKIFSDKNLIKIIIFIIKSNA